MENLQVTWYSTVMNKKYHADTKVGVEQTQHDGM